MLVLRRKRDNPAGELAQKKPKWKEKEDKV